jgi:hypothetical protein
MTAPEDGAGGRRRRGDGGLTPLAEIRPGPEAARLSTWLAARSAWHNVAGPGLAARWPLLSLAGETWVVGLPSEAWRSELDRLAPELLAGLARQPGLAGPRRLEGVLLESATRPPAPGAGRRLDPAATPGGEDDEGGARSRLEGLATRLLARQEDDS